MNKWMSLQTNRDLWEAEKKNRGKKSSSTDYDCKVQHINPGKIFLAH